MVTDPHPSLLEPARAIAAGKQIIDLSAPVLREVVNNATWILQRCQAAPHIRGDVDEDLPPLILYRHMIEACDSIEVLIHNSCAVPTIPLLRTCFEASLGLQYILQSNYANRSLSWLYA